MSVVDKINIYVPSEIGSALKRDMQMFELFKTGDKSYNWNRFLSMVVVGYDETYVQENRAKRDAIRAALQSVTLSENEMDNIIGSFMDNAIQQGVGRRSGKGSVHLSLKPTDQTDDLIHRVFYETNDAISQYFRRMLISYCHKPFSVRERIVFKSNYEKLLKYCKTHQPIYLTTVLDEKALHEVVPYAMACGPEEMFNYLLCQAENPETHQPETRSYALRRIKHVNPYDCSKMIQPQVRERLERMIKKGPQYAINDDDEICVRLTKAGLKLYNRMIYFGRPVYERIEERNGYFYQYYKCSKDQVFLYFKRFEPDAAEILSPERLRDRMKQFFAKGIKTYS